MSRNQERAGALDMPAAMSAPGEPAPPAADHAAAAAAIEATYPQLTFERYPDGRVLPWGRHPTQAFGRLDGCPFYLRVRYGTATLRVWPPYVPTDCLPARHVDEILSASLEFTPPADLDGADLMWFPTTDLAIKTITTLVGDLTTPRRTLSKMQTIRARVLGTIPAEDLYPLLTERYPGLTVVPRGGLWDRTSSAVLRTPRGAYLELLWTDTSAIARVFPASRNPALGHDLAALYGAADTEPSATAASTLDSIARALAAAAPIDDRGEPTGSWDADTIALSAELAEILAIPAGA